ncbi:MAG: hypothetical protein JF588_05850 [Caulobacterales bacterium]|nr:hypothetical protein [Caulobacterales bacterium]
MNASPAWIAALTAAAALSAGTALAHGGNVPEHGGVLKLVADTSVELVRRPEGVQVWVEEEGEEIPSASMTGKLVIVSGADKTEVALTPGAGNMWEAKGLSLTRGANVTVLMVGAAGRDKTAASFTIK